MLLETLSQRYTKARTTNQTSGSFVSKIPTLTEPAADDATATGSAAINLGQGGEYAQNSVHFVPYGVGSNGNTFSVRLIGWRSVHDPADMGNLHKVLWIPVPIAQFLVTLTSSMIGVSGGTIGTTELFGGTMTSSVGNAGVSFDLVNPASTIAAHALVDLKGFRKFEFSFQTGSNTNCNALYALL